MRDEHSGSRRADVLEREAPHLIAPAAPRPVPWYAVPIRLAIVTVAMLAVLLGAYGIVLLATYIATR
jgi:hypothetical protein